MTTNIQTIFFDVGNTLRIVLPDQEFIDRAEAGLMELIGTTESHDALFAKLEERWKAYRKQSKTTLLDASEGEAAGNKKSRRHFPDAERWLYRVLRVYTFA